MKHPADARKQPRLQILWKSIEPLANKASRNTGTNKRKDATKQTQGTCVDQNLTRSHGQVLCANDEVRKLTSTVTGTFRLTSAEGLGKWRRRESNGLVTGVSGESVGLLLSPRVAHTHTPGKGPHPRSRTTPHTRHTHKARRCKQTKPLVKVQATQRTSWGGRCACIETHPRGPTRVIDAGPTPTTWRTADFGLAAVVLGTAPSLKRRMHAHTNTHTPAPQRNKHTRKKIQKHMDTYTDHRRRCAHE